MPLLELKPQKNTNASVLLDKIKRGTQNSPQTIIRGGKMGKDGIVGIINNIKHVVSKNLGKYEDKYEAIRTEQDLISYIDSCIDNGVVALDTETTSLDVMSLTIAGFSLFTPGQKAVYVPINHLSYVSGVKIKNQLSAEFCGEQLQRLVDNNVKVIFFNANFDIRVIQHTLGVNLTAYFDCYIAARLLNENEPESNLKFLHNKYCLQGQEDVFRFGDLFNNIIFTYVPIETGYIYAARDAEITYELYKFQEEYLNSESEACIECGLTRVANLFWNVEMPLIKTIVSMENKGIYFDKEFAAKLSTKYHKMLEEREAKFQQICATFEKQINSYRKVQGAKCKLDNPISINSPAQLAILMYDILGLKSGVKDKPRGTGEDVLKTIDHPLSSAILDYRETSKLLTTYIDKLPNEVKSDGRIHASFNAVAAVTGRFNSTDPNLQQIPSRGPGKETRKMFMAEKGNILISCDYSAQEPRITAHISQDQKMITAYREGKDIYCAIASIAYNVPYEDCLEHDANGKLNPEGKKRRGTAKAIVLGVLYGKGIKAIAEDLQITKPKAQQIYDKIMTSFPGLKTLIEDSKNMARDLGYVETIWGRKRRLPDMQLPTYEFSKIGSTGSEITFDPLDFDTNEEEDNYIDPDLIRYYTKKMDSAWGNKKWEIKEEAKMDGIEITDNGGKIADAERQCLNARVQGSAADMTKMAMLLIDNDEKLKEYGYRILIPIHDELIGEVPYEHAIEAGNRVSELMVAAAKDLCVPVKCDAEWFLRWQGQSLEEDDIKQLISGEKTAEDFD